ncbi:lytic transglycosylase domain-containing protein [Herbiconiux solani]|uniref:aggregation-promoting factor C-terminal-like domain-containing protein n=1 Tax=Herbiconiux solani TaxID=661329 RepID=UPI0008267FDF|nr:lytic transglycosylase domain-containing protein [Herbiconiux solani]
MSKHLEVSTRPAPRTRARGVGRRTTRIGRATLQLAGLAAVGATAFVTVVAPNLGAPPASATFQGSFAQGSVGSQSLEVSGSVAASVFRDGYTAKEAPKPEPVIIQAATPAKAADSGCPDPSAAVADAATAQAVALDLAAQRGWTGEQYDALIALWSRESGWRVNALNKSSCAYGIPQALPGSKMASVGDDWLTNPATQITWGLNYIQGRYGDPVAALAHSDANHWY